MPGDRRNFNTIRSVENVVLRPTGKKHTTVGWDDGGKKCKIKN